MLTIQEVIAKFPEEVQKRYDFSNATYSGALTPITGVRCQIHGEFQQYAAQLRKNGGAGCPACGIKVRTASRTMTTEEFIRRSLEVHRGRYAYHNVRYVNANTHVVVTCAEHGGFRITPNKHMIRGQGCPECAKHSRGRRTSGANVGALAAATRKAHHREDFPNKARAVHGDKYDYSRAIYEGAKQKVEIVCKSHGAFWQTPNHHLGNSQGCPQCGHLLSKAEDEIAKWLSIFTPVIQRDRSVISPRELDIYMPQRNLAVEYCGMYWHSHHDAEDETKNRMRHFAKYTQAQNAGVRLITIYESEWKERRPQIMRLLRNAVGKSKGKLMARKCDLRKVLRDDAVQFFEKYHPQGGSGAGEHYGLFWKDELVACMRFAFGVNDRGSAASQASWTLARYATRVSVSGAASRLFKAFVNEHNPTEVKSFSDNRYFSGGMYERLGFVKEADVSPDYQVWSPKIGLRPKSHYQRRQLPKRLMDHGLDIPYNPETDPRTEREMTFLMGAGRIYDCGKKRWVWRNHAPR